MFSKDEKRKLILEKSRELFITSGYYETKVEDITKALGISKGSFYTYFKTKEEILKEILEMLTAEYVELLEKVDVSKEPKEVLRDYLIMKINIFLKNFRKINTQNLVRLMENPEICYTKDRIRAIGNRFLKENIVKRYGNFEYDLDFIAEYIRISTDEYFHNEMVENRVGEKETYIERKSKQLDQMIEFIHNGLKKK